MDPNENSPSLIDCLDTGDHGLVLDVAPSLESAPLLEGKGPFSKRVCTHIHTRGGDSVVPVVLLMQRSCYEPPATIMPLNNPLLDAAWQKAFEFHRRGDSSNGTILLGDQVNADGRLQAFSPLFRCRHTGKWFCPVCPQCGFALTLCHDEALLAERGLPGYADSLERFLYCETCARTSPASSFFVPRKESGLPDTVQDQHGLIQQYKQLLATLPEEAALPCRGCKDVDVCYGNEALAVQRIEPVSFFPFYMLMFPAPTCTAADFIRMISGGADKGVPEGGTTAGPVGENRFFYQDDQRHFLEILYLKLTFLAQVVGQLAPDGRTENIQEFDFSLDSIGVDLIVPGAGLPAFWNFNARILDSVGRFQTSPFAPALPETPVLHFLAAIWFQTLLVNSVQKAETVFAEIGKFASEWNGDDEDQAQVIGLPDPGGLFLPKQIHWEPLDQKLPERWNECWEQALHLGFQLTHAGLKAGAAWEGQRFKASLEGLRNAIKTEMFKTPVVEAPIEERFQRSDRMSAVLGRILDKWQAQAMGSKAREKSESNPTIPDDDATVVFTPPDAAASESTVDTPQQKEAPPTMPSESQPEADSWSDDIEETVILSSPTAAPPDPANGSTPHEVPDTQSQWEDDIEETVVLKGSGDPSVSSPVPVDNASFDDADQTVVISPASAPPQLPSTDPDADLAATMIQGSAGQAPATPSMPDGDMEATVVIGATPPPPSPPDDNLDATLVQGNGAWQAAKTSKSDISSETPDQQGTDPSDLEATVVIHPAGQPGTPVFTQENGAVEDLEATRIETPRAAERQPTMPPAPSQPPGQVEPPASGPTSDPGPLDKPDEDDDIMEQTVIIRSDIKKE